MTVRLSPKALRFADEAARTYVMDGQEGGADGSAWRAWHAEIKRAGGDLPAAGPDGYVDVPEEVAEVFLVAVDRWIAAMQEQSEVDGDADGDLGNDLAFLSIIHDRLAADLQPRFRL